MNIIQLLLSTAYEQAENVLPVYPGNVPVPNITTGLGGLVGGVINILFAVAGGITMIVLIILGYRMFTAKGNEEEFKKALHGITYAAVGLTVLGLAYAIVLAIMGFQFF